MARLTESGAFTGANANPLWRRASFPEVVGPEEGNNFAKLDCAAKPTITTQRAEVETKALMNFRSAFGVPGRLRELPSAENRSFCNPLRLSLVAASL